MRVYFCIYALSYRAVAHAAYGFRDFTSERKGIGSTMKKIVVLFLIVCMCIPVFAGCTTLQGDDDKGANIQMFLTSFPQSLDPAAVQLDATTSLILSLIYQPLTTINEDGKVEEALAKNWYSYYDDRDQIYKMYFELNETYWSDKILVQAQHVADAWTRILSPDFESPYASILFPIRNAKDYKAGIKTASDLGVYAEGDDLLCVEFEQEYDIDLFAEAVSCIALAPVRSDIIDKAMKDNPVGSKNYDRLQDWDKNAAIMVCNGPYRVQGYEEGTKLVLERNAYYYRDEEDDYLDESVIPYRLTCIYQETTIHSDENGDGIDNYEFEYRKWKNDWSSSEAAKGINYFLGAFSADTYAKVKADGSKMNTADLLSTYTYFFNTKSEITSDAKVRNALSVALDRNRIVEIMGTGMKASTGFVPDGVFGAKSGSSFRAEGSAIYSASANIENAKQLLKEAGVSSGTIRLAYLIPWSKQLYTSETLHQSRAKKVATYNPYENIANYAKETWESLGFTVELTGYTADAFPAALSAGEWDVIGLDYAINSVDAFAYLAPFAKWYSGNIVSTDIDAETFTPHYTGLESDEYDALIDEIVYDSNRTTRAANLHKAEELFASLCPATALFQYTRTYVVSGKLDGIKSESWYGYYDFNELELDDYIKVNAAEAEESFARTEDTNNAK